MHAPVAHPFRGEGTRCELLHLLCKLERGLNGAGAGEAAPVFGLAAVFRGGTFARVVLRKTVCGALACGVLFALPAGPAARLA